VGLQIGCDNRQRRHPHDGLPGAQGASLSTAPERLRRPSNPWKARTSLDRVLWPRCGLDPRMTLTIRQRRRQDAHRHCQHPRTILGLETDASELSLGAQTAGRTTPRMWRRMATASAALTEGNPKRRSEPKRAWEGEQVLCSEDYWLWRLKKVDFCPTAHGPRRPSAVWQPSREVERLFAKSMPSFRCSTSIARGRWPTRSESGANSLPQHSRWTTPRFC